jgi:hypothetical protein
MADDAADTFGGGLRNFLGALGFILPLVGVEELVRHFVDVQHPSLPWWISAILIASGYPIYVSPAIWNRLRGVRPATKPSPLGYLSNEDAELGPAVRDMVWMSAWGKWYAAQRLADSPNGAADHREADAMRAAESIVWRALIDGKLETRGRMPKQMDFETIPSTHWRSSPLRMVRGGPGLWRMVFIPTGGVEITPDGEVVNARDPIAKERTDNLATYDSIIVRARHFEALWPRKHKDTDAKRVALLRRAKKAGADPAEIAKLMRD